MRIEQLIQFSEYIRIGSLTAARQKLFMTPQALHVSIRRLEEELGAKLIEKTSSGVELTDSGKLFMSFAQKVLFEYEKLQLKIDAASFGAQSLSGKLYVYSNMLFQRNALPYIVKQFREAYPNVKLYLFESDTPKIYQEFHETPTPEGDGRLGFLQKPYPRHKLGKVWQSTNNYLFHTLYSGFFYACASPKLNLNKKESIKTLLQYPTILYATSTVTLKHNNRIMNPTLLLLEEYGNIDISYSANTMEFWKHILLDRNCVGYIHSSLVEQGDSIIDGLQLIEVNEKLRSDLGYICSPKKNELEESFIRLVEKYYGPVGPWRQGRLFQKKVPRQQGEAR